MTNPGQEVSARVVVAMDKFKGSVDAETAVQAVGSGIRSAAPDVAVDEVPMADGGDGTVDAAVASGFERVFFESWGPVGQATRASLALSGRRAVVEVANSCGLQLVAEGSRDPLGASSFGVGCGLRAALDRGATEIVLGLGGSASSDGGAGMLTALGARLLDARGDAVAPGAQGLLSLATVDLAGLDPRLAGARIVLASDVDNPLLGEEGAAGVFAPQKGAGADDVAVIERGLTRLSAITARDLRESFEEVPGAGAAGGVGFAGLAYLGAEVVSGARAVMELVDFDERMVGADLVVTGEGQLDRQSERGKAPAAVAKAAQEAGTPCLAVVGRLRLDPAQVTSLGFAAVYELLAMEHDQGRCMSQTPRLLDAVGRRIVDDGWTDRVRPSPSPSRR